VQEQIESALGSGLVGDAWNKIRYEEGNCFAAAFWLANAAKLTGYEPVVVHGSPTLARPPFDKYAHAWVEIAVPLEHITGAKIVGLEDETLPLVLDYSNGLSAVLPAQIYYSIGKIEPTSCRRYSLAAARDHIAKKRHYGPYHRNSGRTL
jgi:hypothetical protein